MEIPTALTGPLEHESEARQRGIKRLAVHVMFEHLMQEADEQLCSREDAIGRAAVVRGFIMESDRVV